MDITQDKLKSYVEYDPNNGQFTWKERRGSVSKGSKAGCKRYDGYLMIRLDKKLYYAHRLAFLYMTGEWPKDQVGHSKGDRSDNRWSKLSEVTNQENAKDMRMKTSNTSGVCGVYKARPYADGRVKWAAQIKVACKTISLYKGSSFECACLARLAGEVRYGYHKDHGKVREVYNRCQ